MWYTLLEASYGALCGKRIHGKLYNELIFSNDFVSSLTYRFPTFIFSATYKRWPRSRFPTISACFIDHALDMLWIRTSLWPLLDVDKSREMERCGLSKSWPIVSGRKQIVERKKKLAATLEREWQRHASVTIPKGTTSRERHASVTIPEGATSGEQHASVTIPKGATSGEQHASVKKGDQLIHWARNIQTNKTTLRLLTLKNVVAKRRRRWHCAGTWHRYRRVGT